MYAVVDLYGAASCVKIASNMESEVAEEGAPMAEVERPTAGFLSQSSVLALCILYCREQVFPHQEGKLSYLNSSF